MSEIRGDRAMSEPAWTPGPWEAECFMVKGGGYVITQTGYSSTLPRSRSHEAEANARLIAAAPSLYEALAHCLDCYEGVGKMDIGDIDWEMVGNALIKARGGEKAQ